MSTLHFYWNAEVLGWLGWLVLSVNWSFLAFRRFARTAWRSTENDWWFVLGGLLAVTAVVFLIALGDALFTGTAV